MDQSRKLSHYDKAGKASMVDVSGKQETRRTAEASAFVEDDTKRSSSSNEASLPNCLTV